ncbi:VOC family protein [Acholeplasma hippikon]|nr:VOC family protein [Acholeplasma hippikon]
MDNILGMHHVTAITSSAPKIYRFFTDILGMRMVKKTVNQDDIQTYHLYFADDRGNPGTTMTFFDFKGIRRAVHGNNEVSRTTFRVPSDEAIYYFEKRFVKYEIKHQKPYKLFNKLMINFEDFDGQRYALISDETKASYDKGTPWFNGPVPNEFGIIGLGPVFMRAKDLERMERILTDILGFRKVEKENAFYLYEVNVGGNNESVIIEHNLLLPNAVQGFGGVHHIAFRVKNREEMAKWEDFFESFGIPNSGFVDRYYFRSLYTRLYPNILFEIATDDPGFIDDEDTYDILGENLTLPPLYKNRSEYVYSVIQLFDSSDANKKREKEYL